MFHVTHIFRVSIILLAGTLLVALTACVAGQPMALAPITAPTPVVSEPVISVPQPVNPGELIGVSIRVDSVAGVIITYEWTPPVDRGAILDGQGTNAITYQTPAEPGTYSIGAKVITANAVIERSVFVTVRETNASTPPLATALPTKAPVLPTPVLPKLVQRTDILPNGEVASPESLARFVGGDPVYWTKRGPVVWGYWDKGHNATFRHPGGNTILTYWAGFPDPRNAGDCQMVIPEADSLTRYVKCPPETAAEFEADGVGIHLIDYTGYFPR